MHLSSLGSPVKVCSVVDRTRELTDPPLLCCECIESMCPLLSSPLLCLFLVPVFLIPVLLVLILVVLVLVLVLILLMLPVLSSSWLCVLRAIWHNCMFLWL